MKLFGVICLGSPRQPPQRWKRSDPNRQELWAQERKRRTAKAATTTEEAAGAQKV